MRHPVTWFLLAVSTLVYVGGNPEALWLWPVGHGFHWWQLATYALCHGSALHLAINMLALLSFGPTLEDEWGKRKLAICYAFCAVAGGVIQSVVSHAPTVGASGALLGLFAAYVMHYPKRPIVSLLIVPLPAWVVLVAYIVLTVLAMAFQWVQGVAHTVHLSGAFVGAALAWAWKPRDQQ